MATTYSQPIPSRAGKEWEKALALTKDNTLAATLTRTFRERGFAAAVRAVAQKKLNRLEETRIRGNYVPAIDYARAYVRLDDREEAFRWLKQACQEPNVFRLLLNSDPLYDPLREDSRFVAFLKA